MKRRAAEDEQRRIEDEELAVASPSVSTMPRLPRVAQNSASSRKIVKKEVEVIHLFVLCTPHSTMLTHYYYKFTGK
jgi:hypothetical protein